MRKTLLSLLMVSIVITTFAVPFASAKPSVMSLLQACNITVDKQVLFIEEDDEARSAKIKLACDTKKVNYNKITISSIGKQVTASKNGNIITVKAQAGGAGYVLLESSTYQGYIGVKVRFRVFQKFDQETIEQRIKPELTNKEKALVSDFAWYERTRTLFINSRDNAIKGLRSVITDGKYSLFDNEILPIVRQAKYEVKLFKPQTAEFQTIHKLLMQYADHQLDGYTLCKQSFANKRFNSKLFDQGSDKIDKSINYLHEAELKYIKEISKIYTLIEEL